MRAIAVLLLLAIAPVFGQVPDAQLTDGTCNGRWWEKAPNLTVKVSYLAGLLDGISAAQPESKLYDLVAPKGLTYGEIAKALDAVYQEPLNGRLPVAMALQIVKMKAEGRTPEKIEEVTRIWRKGYAEVKPATLEVTKQ